MVLVQMKRESEESECFQGGGDDVDAGEESGPSKESSLVKPSREAIGVSDTESSRCAPSYGDNNSWIEKGRRRWHRRGPEQWLRVASR